MDGQTYERGLAVHSRSALTYDLERPVRHVRGPGRVRRRRRKGMGRVDCRVFADDKELYANPDLRADAPPVKLVAAGRGGRAAPARRRLRPGPGHGRPRDLGERPPLSASPRRRRAAADAAQPRRPNRIRRQPRNPGAANESTHAHVSRPIVLALGRCSASCAALRRRRPTTSGRSRPSRSTNGRSGSAARRRSRSTPSRIYRNAMPAVVGTSRPEARRTRSWPASSRSRRSRSSSSSASRAATSTSTSGRRRGRSSPTGRRATERAGRVQWFKSDLTKAPPAGVPLGLSPGRPTGSRSSARIEPALYLKHESQAERFLAYDTELTIPVPLKIRGGPDEYTLQNLTGHRLLDVAVIAPTDNGYRVGWLDELPSAAPEGTGGGGQGQGEREGGREEEKEVGPREGRGRLREGRDGREEGSAEGQGQGRAQAPAGRGRRERAGPRRPGPQPARSR